MNSFLDVLCDVEREVFLKIEDCPDYKEARLRTLAIATEITSASPEHKQNLIDLDNTFLEAFAALEKEGYRLGLLDGARLVMELMGKG